MKRFYISLLLIAIIACSALFFNNKIIGKTNELIELTDSNEDADKIISWWYKNKIWFEVLVSEDLSSDVETKIFLCLNPDNSESAKEEIKITAQKIIDSTKISIGNIL